MAKGKAVQKTEKKQAEKNLKEKRAEKKAKKDNKKIKKFGSCLTEKLSLIYTLRAIYKTVAKH